MRFLNDIQSLRSTSVKPELPSRSPLGVTIGNFDGMHVGHQLLFSTLQNELTQRGPESRRMLFTFEPHPRRVFEKISRKEARTRPDLWALSLLRDKIQFARAAGFDFFFCKRFTLDFASLTAEAFVKQYLVDALGANLVVVGHDWRFGKGREGDGAYLKRMGSKYGFEVKVVEPVVRDGIRISSTGLKDALALGDLEKVRLFLGREFEVSDRAWKGDGRGSRIGFPTANLRCLCRVLPADGVYATYATVEGKTYPAAANIGTRPTVDGTQRFLETHLLGWNGGALYSKRISVRFMARLRAERKFNSIDELRTAIRADVEHVSNLLAPVS